MEDRDEREEEARPPAPAPFEGIPLCVEEEIPGEGGGVEREDRRKRAEAPAPREEREREQREDGGRRVEDDPAPDRDEEAGQPDGEGRPEALAVVADVERVPVARVIPEEPGSESREEGEASREKDAKGLARVRPAADEPGAEGDLGDGERCEERSVQDEERGGRREAPGRFRGPAARVEKRGGGQKEEKRVERLREEEARIREEQRREEEREDAEERRALARAGAERRRAGRRRQRNVTTRGEKRKAVVR